MTEFAWLVRSEKDCFDLFDTAEEAYEHWLWLRKHEAEWLLPPVAVTKAEVREITGE